MAIVAVTFMPTSTHVVVSATTSCPARSAWAARWPAARSCDRIDGDETVTARLLRKDYEQVIAANDGPARPCSRNE
jgi:hypothetical protein